MNRASWRNSLSLFVLVLVAVVLSWIVHSAVTARYQQFSACGPVENFSLVVPEQETNPQPPSVPSSPSQFGYDGFFWSEAAFHYRTTLMYAVDWYQNPAILAADRWQEFPHGVNAKKEYSILMEPVLGTLFRLFARHDSTLVGFLLWAMPILHAILLFPLFFLGRTLSRSSLAGLLSVAVFATCTLAFSPIVEALYVKETFSWILLATFLVGHFSFQEDHHPGWLVLGAIGLLLFLLSWHLAQFILVPFFLVGMAGTLWKEKPGILQPGIYLGIYLVAGFSPWLRERAFWLGLPALVLVFWVLLALAILYFPAVFAARKNRVWGMGGGLVLAIAIGLLNHAFADSYSHVGGLLWHRVLNFFEKPLDPRTLPFAVRVFWVAPFSSPRWPVIEWGLGINGFLFLAALVWSLGKSRHSSCSAAQRSLAWCTFLFFLAFLFVERLAPVFLFLASILVAVLAADIARKFIRDRISAFLVLSLFLVFPVLNFAHSLGGMVRLSLENLAWRNLGGGVAVQPRFDTAWPAARAEMFRWIRENTPAPGSHALAEQGAFVGEIGICPQLLLYTGRPVVLNSQFENAPIRSRYEAYLQALFADDETALVAFFEKYDARFLFLNRDWATASGRNSPRYLAGRTGRVDLRANVSRLHFAPNTLDHFRPVFENGKYRIFEYVPSGGERRPGNWGAVSSRWWNIRNFSVDRGTLPSSADDRRKQACLDKVFREFPARLGKVFQGVEKKWTAENQASAPRPLLIELQRSLAAAKMAEALSLHPVPESGEIARREREIRNRLQEIFPPSGLTLREEILRILNGTPGRDPGILQEILPCECTPKEYSLVAETLVLLGEFESAGELFGKGGSMFQKPVSSSRADGLRATEEQEELWEKTILYLSAGGKADKARALAWFCFNHMRPESQRRAFFSKAAHAVSE